MARHKSAMLKINGLWSKCNIFFSEFVAILMCEEGTFGKVTGENFAEDIAKQPLELVDAT